MIVWILDRLGFHNYFTRLLLQCISTVKYAFLINGQAQGCVIPQRGIRQGDPLSPYIFILCGEVLSGLCRRAQENGSLPGIRVSLNSPRLNHLLFAQIVDRIRIKAMSWSSKCLSSAGKLTLIQAVLSAIPTGSQQSGQSISLPRYNCSFGKQRKMLSQQEKTC